jgi:hypothetical protein
MDTSILFLSHSCEDQACLAHQTHLAACQRLATDGTQPEGSRTVNAEQLPYIVSLNEASCSSASARCQVQGRAGGWRERAADGVTYQGGIPAQ